MSINSYYTYSIKLDKNTFVNIIYNNLSNIYTFNI